MFTVGSGCATLVTAEGTKLMNTLSSNRAFHFWAFMRSYGFLQSIYEKMIEDIIMFGVIVLVAVIMILSLLVKKNKSASNKDEEEDIFETMLYSGMLDDEDE